MMRRHPPGFIKRGEPNPFGRYSHNQRVPRFEGRWASSQALANTKQVIAWFPVNVFIL